MARQTGARPPPAAAATATSARPLRARARAVSVPAFGGWDKVAGAGGAGAEAPDYSLDFTKIRAARMLQRRKALSWSSFVVGNAAVAEAEAEAPGGGDDKDKCQWSSESEEVASDGDRDGDDGRERRRRRQLRRLRSAAADDLPIQPRRATPKGRGKFKGYLFGCVSGQW